MRGEEEVERRRRGGGGGEERRGDERRGGGGEPEERRGAKEIGRENRRAKGGQRKREEDRVCHPGLVPLPKERERRDECQLHTASIVSRADWGREAVRGCVERASLIPNHLILFESISPRVLVCVVCVCVCVCGRGWVGILCCQDKGSPCSTLQSGSGFNG